MERIKVSDNRRFLVTESGKPFFWLGDTAWELFHRCSLEESEFFLENRRQKGFTVIQAVALAEIDGLNTPNVYGERPLHDNDPDRPNEAYFAHIDRVIQQAADKGIYIALLPTWGDKVTIPWGAGPVVFDPGSAARYGEWIGRRYRDTTNVLWVNGGDRAPIQNSIDYTEVWRALAAGLRRGAGDEIFMTFHPRGGESSANPFHNDDWLSMNMWQSGHMEHDLPNWDLITMDYRRLPTKPVLDGEPAYEDHPVNPFTRQWKDEYGRFDDYDVRKQAYRAVFAGACGHTYGHHSIWQFYTTGRAPINFPYPTWQEAVDRPGAGQLIHLKNLMLSRPYLTRVPAQSLVIGNSSERPNHIRATGDSEGSYAMIYIPNGDQEFGVRLDVFGGKSLKAWWYDPRTGAAQSVEVDQGQTSARFTSPSTGDYVLVLDDAAYNFPTPGTGV